MNRHATITARRALLKSACGLGLVLSAVAGGCGNNGASNQGNQGGAPGNAAASGSGAGEAGGSAEAKSIAIGYNPTIAQPQALVGVHDGRYAAAMPGVSVTGQDFAAGPEVVESLRAGKIDIGCSGPFPP
jgi:ABC-type nitrate/sulfonate/bicarbonate transport system substrate-binding protein